MPPITNNLHHPIGIVRRSCRLLIKSLVEEESEIKVKQEKRSQEEVRDNNHVYHLKKKIKSEPNVAIIKDKPTKVEYIKPTPELTKGVSKNSIEKSITTCNIKHINTTNFLSITKLPKPDGLLEVDSDELDLERTLLGGQSFRWVKEEIGDKQLVFTGIILDHIIRLWRISDTQIAYKRLNKDHDINKNSIGIDEILKDYFQLKYNLKELYENWSKNDEHVAKCCEQYKGFRILRQDPVENVFSFICATNNNIKRISQMVEKLCSRYGNILDIKDDETKKTIYDSYHSFPPVERLAHDDVFQCLRYELGFGYRAKFINETAKELVRLTKQSALDDNKEIKLFLSPRDYLLSLRKLPYKESCKQLMKFPGIGRKVADCICLMSMDHLNSVPIDCHIYEIVCRNYMPNLRNERKTLTESVHDLISDYFNKLHGDLAGWSTSVLFIAELKHLKHLEKSSSVSTKKVSKQELKEATKKKRKK